MHVDHFAGSSQQTRVNMPRPPHSHSLSLEDHQTALGWQVIQALRANHWIPVDLVHGERVSDDIQQAFSSSVKPQVFPVAYYFIRIQTFRSVMVMVELVADRGSNLPSYRQARLGLFDLGLASQQSVKDHQAPLRWQKSCALSQVLASQAPLFVGGRLNRSRFSDRHERVASFFGAFLSS